MNTLKEPCRPSGSLITSFQQYNASVDEFTGLEKRAWQGCSSGGPQISTSDVDFIRNWLFSNSGTINVLPGTWLRREWGNARLCILNNDKNVKTFENGEQGWVDNFIAHDINCCATSNWYERPSPPSEVFLVLYCVDLLLSDSIATVDGLYLETRRVPRERPFCWDSVVQVPC